ncbi:hypothetical protein [uncultured Clostridium sp.]|uniref:hypothetical protein n=1 Tax=uncultured Clostridium sp. TaxID=59620 RepID=UPI0028E631AD|nr:hypothetical protein [uncultured Clostridium sp.]
MEGIRINIFKKVVSVFVIMLLFVSITACQTTKKNSEDSIGGIVEFNDEEYIYYKIFDEVFDNAKKTQDELSVTLSSLKIINGKINGKSEDIMVITMVIYNDSDSTKYIEPNKGFIVNRDNEKINASLINSDNINGGIKSKDLKDVNVVFPMAPEVLDGENSFKYIIDAPKDENMNKLGEALEFEIKKAMPIKFDSKGNVIGD